MEKALKDQPVDRTLLSDTSLNCPSSPPGSSQRMALVVLDHPQPPAPMTEFNFVHVRFDQQNAPSGAFGQIGTAGGVRNPLSIETLTLILHHNFRAAGSDAILDVNELAGIPLASMLDRVIH